VFRKTTGSHVGRNTGTFGWSNAVKVFSENILEFLGVRDAGACGKDRGGPNGKAFSRKRLICFIISSTLK